MESILVNKEDLIKTLEHNLEMHIETFEEIRKKFLEHVIERAEEDISLAKQDKFPKIRHNLPVPENHSKDYNRAINMLKMDVRNEVNLTEEQYAQFIDNDWAWQRSFTSTTEFYTQRR